MERLHGAGSVCAQEAGRRIDANDEMPRPSDADSGSQSTRAGGIEVRVPAVPGAVRTGSLMVSWNRLFPCPRSDDRPILQQGACVLIKERLRIAREVKAPA